MCETMTSETTFRIVILSLASCHGLGWLFNLWRLQSPHWFTKKKAAPAWILKLTNKQKQLLSVYHKKDQESFPQTKRELM